MGLRTLCVGILIFTTTALSAEQVGTTFTYQGQLNQTGQPAQGEFDFVFQLFDVDTGGIAVAAPVPIEDVPVDEGIFSVPLDFGAVPFSGDQLWLEISVREGESTGGFTNLAPRHKISAAPFSIHAQSVAAGTVGSTEANSAEVQLRVAESCPSEQAIRVIDSTGSVTCEPLASPTHDHDSNYSAINHAHSAADIASGTLSTDRFSAYSDLGAEGYLDSNSSADLLTRAQLDSRFAFSSHTHAIALANSSEGSPETTFGVVHANGSSSNGSSNWTSRYNEANNHYEITFSEKEYTQTENVTIITPISEASSPTICNTQASEGIMIVRCYDASGSPGEHPFQFVTYSIHN